MRIISGLYKGRIINRVKSHNTRETMDRVKESIFAMIQEEVENSISLDLFAGSGQLGIEAISNGSQKVYFVDKDINAIKTIQKNIDMLNINEKSVVIYKDYKETLNYFVKNNIKFNLIFLDPPYELDILNDILKFINKNNILYENGQVICELYNNNLKNSYDNLILSNNKKYGEKYVLVYKEQ